MSDEQEHNVEACYSVTNEYGMRYVPTFLCSCGRRYSGLSWEDAGHDYDLHLDEIKAKRRAGS